MVSILSEESEHREWSTVVDISITPPSSELVFFNPINIFWTSFTTLFLLFYNLLFRLTSKFIFTGSQKTQSYTAYNKIKASDSVTAGTTTSTTSTTSTPGNMPSINITSTFQYLGCYKPPSSLTTDVDFVYTVPFDTSKYKAVPAFDRSLSGYHGTLNIETMKFT